MSTELKQSRDVGWALETMRWIEGPIRDGYEVGQAGAEVCETPGRRTRPRRRRNASRPSGAGG